MKTDFYEHLMPIVNEKLEKVEENYDDLMTSFISYSASTLVEHSLAAVDNGNVTAENFQKYLESQLRRTVEALNLSVTLIMKKYVEELQNESISDAAHAPHPTVQ